MRKPNDTVPKPMMPATTPVASVLAVEGRMIRSEVLVEAKQQLNGTYAVARPDEPSVKGG
jgi:hypothetical protein